LVIVLFVLFLLVRIINNTMAKRKCTKGQTKIYKTYTIELKIE
jgi:hypothetical protein